MTSPVVRRRTLAVLATLILASLGTLLRGYQPIVQSGDAYVLEAKDHWAVGNSLIEYSLGRGESGVGAHAITNLQTGVTWHRLQAPDAFVRVNGTGIGIGAAPLALERTEATEWFGGVRLDFQYRLAAAGLVIVRSYACYPGSSVIETWTTFRQEGGQPVTLADLTTYALTIGNGTLSWIGGLQTPEDAGGPFTRYSGDLDDGQVFYLGASGRSSEQSLPWYSVTSDGEEFFGSLLWSGAWQFRAERRADAVLIQLGLPPFETTLAAGGTLETPHAIFGVTAPRLPEPASALQAFVHNRLRLGRPLDSYVTYNTWYSMGTAMDEASVTAEMDLAASIGVEQFVVDAGWWVGASTGDPGDFISRWGNWQVDLERFPNGLAFLSNYAHDRGMRFGIWVEPERVDRATVGLPGLAKESFLATNDGRYDEDFAVPAPRAGRRRARSRVAAPIANAGRGVSAQICLVDPSARAWLYGRLVEFIEEAQPDYLKWDNNFWITCNRPGHGHGPTDANFQHHRALNSVLDDLRERFPDLDIENCASGGNRLSLDMLAHTDAAWLDDKTDPSSRVRHSLQGLLGLLPPAYMLSFFTSAIEAADDTHSNDTSYVFRSRMIGTPGLSWLLTGMNDESRSVLSAEIRLFKRLRPILQAGAAILLSPQASVRGWSGWDAVEHVTSSGRDAVVMAYNTFDAPATAVVRPVRLLPNATYVVESADGGFVASATGQELMAQGLELQSSGHAVGHVIVLHAE